MLERGRVGFRIATELERPPSKLIEAFRSMSASVVADALGGLGGVMTAEIRKLSGRPGTVCGPALTVKTRPHDNLMVHKAVDLVQPGDILVVDADGVTTGAILGELLIRTLRKKGAVAVVVDGAIRDIAALKTLDIPVFARGVTPLGPHKDGPGEINFPVACGGVSVRPGDLVVADDDGVVVVPMEAAAVVLEKAEQITAREMRRVQEIESGYLERPWVEETLRAKGV